MGKTKKFLLAEKELPTQWYNIVADMQTKPMPMLHPGTRQPIKAEDLYPLFAKGLADQEMNQTETWIDIPEEVREKTKNLPPYSLVRAII
jgi:tryptophan synthase beta chain